LAVEALGVGACELVIVIGREHVIASVDNERGAKALREVQIADAVAHASRRAHKLHDLRHDPR